eukprot:TRINITY_DN2402_c0_g2_i1.p1 TRINITY_DN2402_c0_g2~~TRINITY_DN2402_c0_g2_i1.p1  ORF type:complete len:1540 (-),score=356.43 TRINITY_DN2402_c0_g2_i1:72-4364(-)
MNFGSSHNRSGSRESLKDESSIISATPNLGAESWSREAFMIWLQENELRRIGSLFFENWKYRVTSEAIELLMFENHVSRDNILTLIQSPVDALIDLVLIPINSPLKMFWDYEEYLRDFLIVYRIFISPENFVSIIIQKYEYLIRDISGYDNQSKSTLLYVLKLLVLNDLTIINNEDIKGEILKLLHTTDDEFTDEKSELLHIMEHPNDFHVQRLFDPPQSILPASKNYTISEVSPLELARQLTVMEEDIFSEIHFSEYLDWKNDDGPNNISKLIEHSNHIANWITTELIKYPTIKARTDLLVKFIQVMEHLEELRNYNSLVTVLGSLHSLPVSKLKKSWEILPRREREVFERITDLTSQSGHYRNYFQALEAVDYRSVPCIPIVRICCEDLSKLNEIVDNYIKEKNFKGWINWAKMSKIGKYINNISQFKTKYNIKPVPKIISMIENGEAWSDENICWEICKLREEHPIDRENLQYCSDEILEDVVLSERDWAIILTGANLETYDYDDVILKEGASNSYLYRIKSGYVRVEKDINGEMVELATLGPNTMFGEISMVKKGGKTTAWIIAESKQLELYKITVDLVLKICSQQPRISSTLNLILARKLASQLKNMNSSGKMKKNRRRSQSVTIKKEAEISIDSKFMKLFRLPNQVVVREFACNMGKSGKKRKRKGYQGTLYISQEYLCFSSTTFGFKIREVIQYSEILTMFSKRDTIRIDSTTSKRPYILSSFDNFQETYRVIKDIWSNKCANRKFDILPSKNNKRIPRPLNREYSEKRIETIDLNPTKEDWALILKGSHQINLKAGDSIVEEGNNSRQIYQVVRGSCIIFKKGINQPLGEIDAEDGIFGEIAFLEGGTSTASVIAKKDTCVNVIEAYFLKILFQHHPHLAGRFYHYLAVVLSQRVTAREKKSSNENSGGDGSSESTSLNASMQNIGYAISDSSSEDGSGVTIDRSEETSNTTINVSDETSGLGNDSGSLKPDSFLKLNVAGNGKSLVSSKSSESLFSPNTSRDKLDNSDSLQRSGPVQKKSDKIKRLSLFSSIDKIPDEKLKLHDVPPLSPRKKPRSSGSLKNLSFASDSEIPNECSDDSIIRTNVKRRKSKKKGMFVNLASSEESDTIPIAPKKKSSKKKMMSESSPGKEKKSKSQRNRNKSLSKSERKHTGSHSTPSSPSKNNSDGKDHIHQVKRRGPTRRKSMHITNNVQFEDSHKVRRSSSNQKPLKHSGSMELEKSPKRRSRSSRKSMQLTKRELKFDDSPKDKHRSKKRKSISKRGKNRKNRPRPKSMSVSSSSIKQEFDSQSRKQKKSHRKSTTISSSIVESSADDSKKKKRHSKSARKSNSMSTSFKDSLDESQTKKSKRSKSKRKSSISSSTFDNSTEKKSRKRKKSNRKSMTMSSSIVDSSIDDSRGRRSISNRKSMSMSSSIVDSSMDRNC